MRQVRYRLERPVSNRFVHEKHEVTVAAAGLSPFDIFIRLMADAPFPSTFLSGIPKIYACKLSYGSITAKE